MQPKENVVFVEGAQRVVDDRDCIQAQNTSTVKQFLGDKLLALGGFIGELNLLKNLHHSVDWQPGG